MQTYRGTSRAKRYKPNQQDRCTAAGYKTPAGVTEPQAETSPDKQSHPPQLPRGSHGGQDTHCLLVAPPPIISIMFTSFSCLVSTNCLSPPAADEGTRPSSARSSRFFLYICQFLFIFVNTFFNLHFFYIFQDMEQ